MLADLHRQMPFLIGPSKKKPGALRWLRKHWKKGRPAEVRAVAPDAADADLLTYYAAEFEKRLLKDSVPQVLARYRDPEVPWLWKHVTHRARFLPELERRYGGGAR